MTNDDIRRFIEFENDATVIRCYEPDLVPGLIQTRGYMAALARLAFPTRAAARRERLVDFRMARQQVLRRYGGHVVLHTVIGEPALRREIAPPDVMREQLRSILEALDDDGSGVVVRVAPITLGIRAVLGGSLVVMDFQDPDETGLVYLEGRASGQYLQAPADLERHRDQFDELMTGALNRADSRSMIEELIRG
jgi:hypothetical protein